jgi:hypothetical protein
MEVWKLGGKKVKVPNGVRLERRREMVNLRRDIVASIS